MKKSDFYFDLPPELIAQTPLEERSDSQLMLLDKKTGRTDIKHFYDIPDMLNAGDLLIMNDSRVIPARLFGVREDTGGAIEILMLHQTGECWECIVRPGKRCRPGDRFIFGNGEMKAEIERVTDAGNRIIRFEHDGVFLEMLDRLGETPLPPYIKEKLNDPERYQTVYAKEPGSAAAPTAGLHFTKALMERIQKRGAVIKYVTLHVGLGTFRPVKEDNVTDHIMHSEFCVVSEDTAAAVRRAKNEGNRVIAVGTTSLRTLETFSHSGKIEAGSGWSDIFIYPGYKFKTVDCLITNFHLPESTLIMLVSALAGREQVLEAYKKAVDERMRFFSFGDAMFVADFDKI